MVGSPYASIMDITEAPKKVIKNVRRVEEIGALTNVGFYESIDFTPSRLKYNETYALVKNHMAHHQGLILVSINNLINNEIMQKRFSNNPEIEAIDILLQEKMPKNIIITKEKKEKIEKYWMPMTVLTQVTLSYLSSFF